MCNFIHGNKFAIYVAHIASELSLENGLRDHDGILHRIPHASSANAAARGIVITIWLVNP